MSLEDKIENLLAVFAEYRASVPRLVEIAVERVLAKRQDDSLQPLHVILGLNGKDPAAAARARLRRDPELAKLGIVISTHTVTCGPHAGATVERLVFKPSAVEAYFAAKGGRNDDGR